MASTSRSAATAPSSAKSRRPDPRTSGWISSTYSSTRSCRISDRTSSPLPSTDEVLARLLLEPGHGLGGVALEQRGVLHGSGSAQRRRRDVLLRVVEHLGERVVGLAAARSRRSPRRSVARTAAPGLAIPSAATPAHDRVAVRHAPSRRARSRRGGPRRAGPAPASRRRASGC